MGSPLLLLLLLRWPGLLAAEQVAVLEVLLEEQPGVSALLRGEVVESSGDGSEGGEREELEGNLVLVRVEEASEIAGEPEEQEPWIGLLPVDSTASRGGQESFADAVVNKMKRALVLGASALIILALNPNPVSEMDLSPVLSKPIIVVQTSENVTKLIGALLRYRLRPAFLLTELFEKDQRVRCPQRSDTPPDGDVRMSVSGWMTLTSILTLTLLKVLLTVQNHRLLLSTDRVGIWLRIQTEHLVLHEMVLKASEPSEF